MKITHLLFATGILLTMLILPSCLDDDDDVSRLYPNALVTVKEAADETVYFQLDETTTLLPVNITSHPFDSKEVRALVNYEEVDDSSEEYDQAVRVNWIDSIRTKPAPNREDNDNEYGTTVEIVSDWVTIAEDG